MFELLVNGLKKYMDATLILKNITFQAYEEDKIGIVGANGSGKSTILKLIAGVEPMNYWPGYPQTSSNGYDEGFISIPDKASVAYLEQIPVYPEHAKVIDVLNLAFDEIHTMEKKMRSMEEKMTSMEGADLEKALRQYGDLVQLYEAKGGYEVEEKLNRICTGLHLDKKFIEKDFSLLSGGEKTTVALGKLLMDQPDILLLDEPTNHLDISSVEWLEDYLKNYKGIVIVVSHDRYFLDNVVNKIVEIEDMESICYKGNFSSYARQKEENMRIQYEHFLEQQKKINAMEKTVKDLRDWAMRADNNKFFRRAASIQIKLDKMQRIERPAFDKPNMKLDIKGKQRSGVETMKAGGLSKCFGEKVILDNADLLVQYGERVAMIGPNGCGKTTFIKMLLGEEKPDSGWVEVGANAMTAYLPQRIHFENEEITVLDCFRDGISILEGKAREYLSKYMFYGNSVFKKVKQLSGGEKIRLKLAKLLHENVNLLILDEPTNHLDIESIETFEEALESFQGTVFFISHDRYFINNIAGRIIAFENATLKSYRGNYDDYKKEISRREVKEVKKLEPKKEKVKKPTLRNENQRKEIEQDQIETKIESVENEIRDLDLAMTAEELGYEDLNKLYQRKNDLGKELETLMALWLEI